MEEKKTNKGKGDYMKLVLKDGKEHVVKKPLGARFGCDEEGYTTHLGICENNGQKEAVVLMYSKRENDLD